MAALAARAPDRNVLTERLQRACGLLAVALGVLGFGSAARALDFAAEDPNQAVLACLTPSADERGKPTYPEEEYLLNRGEVVAVRLRFTRPDAGPEVDLLRSSVAPPFADAVREHVARYRLPCLQPGAQVAATQEFVFRPRDGKRVLWSSPSAVHSDRVKQLAACVQPPNTDGNYPRPAMRDGDEGRLLLLLTFRRPDEEPEVKVLYPGLRPRLVGAAVDMAKAHRMPCLAPGDAPLSGLQVYEFQIDGNKRAAFSDVALAGFLKSVKGLEGQRLYFDFTTMSCPFEVQMTLYQPYASNPVGEVGGTAEGRTAFLQWLESVTLKLSAKDYSRVVGETIRIRVPCTVLDLK